MRPSSDFPMTQRRFREFLIGNLDVSMGTQPFNCPISRGLSSVTGRAWRTGFVSSGYDLTAIEHPGWVIEFIQKYDAYHPTTLGRGALWILDTYCLKVNDEPYSEAYPHKGSD